MVSISVQNDHLERFYAIAHAIREGRASDCPILHRLAIAYKPEQLFVLHPEVARIQAATDNDPLRTALACLAAVVGAPLASGIMFQQAEHVDTFKDLKAFPYYARRSFAKVARDRPLDFAGWAEAYPWREPGSRGLLGQSAFLAQWAMAAPLGPCRDAEYFFRTWPQARYGLGWLEGVTSGQYWMKGNRLACTKIVTEVLDKQHDPQYIEYNRDFQWTGPVVPMFAELFGRHSFELLIAQNGLHSE